MDACFEAADREIELLNRRITQTSATLATAREGLRLYRESAKASRRLALSGMRGPSVFSENLSRCMREVELWEKEQAHE